METDRHGNGPVEKRTELFNRHVLPHRNLIYKLCIDYSRSASDVEDNYNEVLINFFKYIETYDPARSIQTWLHIVTKRLVRDLNRRNGAFRRSDDVDVSEIADGLPDESGGSGMDAHDCLSLYGDEVLEALNSLKPIYRETLLLQQAGYRLHEIMEISYRNGSLKTKNLETVKSRLFLARQQMRQLIARDGKRKKFKHMNTDSYLSFSCKLFEHPLWNEDRVYSRFEAWLDLLQGSERQDNKQLSGNRLTEVKRGQSAVSLRRLAKRWKWGKLSFAKKS